MFPNQFGNASTYTKRDWFFKMSNSSTETNIKDIIITIETMSTSYNAVVLQIGAAVFDKTTGKVDAVFVTNINPESQKKYGRIIDKRTVEFWKRQPEETIRDVFIDQISVESAIHAFDAFLRKNLPSRKYSLCWMTDLGFVSPIIHSLKKSLGSECVWLRTNERDCKTILSEFGKTVEKKSSGCIPKLVSYVKAMKELYA